MKKTMVLAGLCAVAVLGLSGCKEGYKSVEGYKKCMSKTSGGDACFAFSNTECTGDIIDAMAKKGSDSDPKPCGPSDAMSLLQKSKIVKSKMNEVMQGAKKMQEEAEKNSQEFKKQFDGSSGDKE